MLHHRINHRRLVSTVIAGISTVIAGIDPDTKQIVVSLPGGEFLVAATKERIAEHRFKPLMLQFRVLVLQLHTDWIYIERPPMGVNPRSTIDQAMVVGGIASILIERGLNFSLVDPGTWKKGLLGNGRADKPLIRDWAIANLGLPSDLKQDQYDAACIRRWGELSSGR